MYKVITAQPEMVTREDQKGGNNKYKTVTPSCMTKLLKRKTTFSRIFCCQMQNRFENEKYVSCAVYHSYGFC